MDAFGLELALERLEAVIAGEVAATTRALWAGGSVGDAPVLTDGATRRTLAQAQALPGEAGALAARLWRSALAASFAAADPARAILPADRSEAGFLVAAEARGRIATRLGFGDAWALARACAGEVDETPAALAVADPIDAGDSLDDLEPALAAVLADPAPLLARLAAAHGVDPATRRVTVERASAPLPGRTFVIEPGRDVRVRVWWRPGAHARGVMRVLLHELGHALLPAEPASRALDEGAAAWMGSMLERAGFGVAVLGLAERDAQRLARFEQAARATRRARLDRLAAVERAFYRDGGVPPWRDELAWIDPGASASYAAAEAVRDALDRQLGAGWPTASLISAG